MSGTSLHYILLSMYSSKNRPFLSTFVYFFVVFFYFLSNKLLKILFNFIIVGFVISFDSVNNDFTYFIDFFGDITIEESSHNSLV